MTELIIPTNEFDAWRDFELTFNFFEDNAFIIHKAKIVQIDYCPGFSFINEYGYIMGKIPFNDYSFNPWFFFNPTGCLFKIYCQDAFITGKPRKTYDVIWAELLATDNRYFSYFKLRKMSNNIPNRIKKHDEA